MKMRVDRLQDVDGGICRAYADLILPTGMILRGCRVLDVHGRRAVAVPRRKERQPDGSWINIDVVAFASQQLHSEWEAAALEAVNEYLGWEAGR
jgi:DNA-binding cell septation regulator SpoVG